MCLFAQKDGTDRVTSAIFWSKKRNPGVRPSRAVVRARTAGLPLFTTKLSATSSQTSSVTRTLPGSVVQHAARAIQNGPTVASGSSTPISTTHGTTQNAALACMQTPIIGIIRTVKLLHITSYASLNSVHQEMVKIDFISSLFLNLLIADSQRLNASSIADAVLIQDFQWRPESVRRTKGRNFNLKTKF